MRNALCALMLCLAGPALAQPNAPRMHLVEELRIDGKKMGFDERQLAFLLVTPRGRMAFVDQYKFRVNFFDAAGNHIGDFGGKGYGPGEFSVVHAIAGERAYLEGGTVGDSIWLYDGPYPHARVTYLSSQGDFLRTMEASGGTPAFGAAAGDYRRSFTFVGAYADGGALWRVSFYHVVVCTLLCSGRDSISISDSAMFVRAPKTGESERKIAMVPPDPSSVTIETGTLRAPFGSGTGIAVAPDGNRIAVTTWRATSLAGGLVAVTVINSKRDTVFSRQYPFAGIAIDPRTADNLVAQMVRDHDHIDADGTHEFDKRTADEFKRKLRAAVPLSRSPVGWARIGLDNSLWIPLPRAVGGTPWLVLDEKGDPFGTVLMPSSVDVPSQMTRSNVWTVERRKDGPPSIVRYRIAPGAY